MVEIDRPIVAYSVNKKAQEAGEDANMIELTPPDKRPKRLEGSTYKIKTPDSDHAMYITINDVVMNEGTELEHRRPFEIFINSKDMQQFQWIVALTRVISAVFRKGGPLEFLVGELQSVFDPKGGYFKKGVYKPSLIAELADVLEEHFKKIGMIQDDESIVPQESASESDDDISEAGVKPTGPLCPDCSQPMVVEAGCTKCLSCNNSKCG